ncbi:CLUMA_CG004915, isoform A [Clunio marinus]|uniref:CLUMA_CG004915, isoform A n=1 Tax=Clunio marinus TaxID=568069 RepID=A0A1J1HYN5_9DIPT|nr:CLUMA_CG004915, isoform A [Clunio marinus]
MTNAKRSDDLAFHSESLRKQEKFKKIVILFEDLPQHELGKLPRELYPICITNDITKLDEYKEMFKLLKFVSKEKILIKLEKIIEVIEYFVQDTQQEELRTKMRQLREPFVYFYKNIEESGINTITNTPASTHERFELKKKGASGRQEMMEKLKEMAKHNIAPVVTKYEQALWKCIDYINRKMEKYLRPLQEAPFFL